MSKDYYVYILSSHKKILYTGVTNNLQRRIWEHKQGLVKGFTQKYKVNRLVYFEVGGSIDFAIQREKNIKKWKRSWKINLIEESNPEWRDLYLEF